MYRNLLITLRTALGLMILMLGIIGLFLPILQGWLLILVAIPLISPAYGKRMIEKAKEWRIRITAWWQRGKKIKAEETIIE